jgi:hypothetical protein
MSTVTFAGSWERWFTAGRAVAAVTASARVSGLDTEHAAMQFLERLGWAIGDAEEAERR